MAKKKKNKIINLVETIIALIIVIISAICIEYNFDINELIKKGKEYIFSSENEYDKNIDSNISEDLKVYFIDVGQADCILIRNQDKNMLIDAGNNADGRKLVKYLKGLGITRFDILVGTHPHEDHIGGLDNIIKEFDIGDIYMPKAYTSTKTFEDVIDAISNKNLRITAPVINKEFELGECKFKILYSGTDCEDLNETSIMLKMTFKEKTFIFTGDASTANEKTIINKDIKADVLKVGHHGSRTSTSQEFLDKVDPEYAIISVEKGNSYSHPHKETMNRLTKKSINIYRTDESGTIIIKSDGKQIQIETEKTDTNVVE